MALALQTRSTHSGPIMTDSAVKGGVAGARGLKAATGLGILCILANGILLAVNDTFAKLVGESLPVGEMIVIRGAMAVALIYGYLAVSRQTHLLKIHNWKAMAIYSLSMVIATHLFLRSLQLMPLGDATAITFVSPILTTLMAVFFLGEKVGWRRWAAVFVGFLGVILLLLPSGQGYGFAAALLPLVCALMVSLRDVVSRGLSKTDASIAILFHNTLWVTLSGFLELPFEPWVVPALEPVLFLLAAACLLAAAQYLIVEAYRFAELSLLMPFRYAGLIFAALAGYLVWGDVPTWNVVAGSIVITLSGVYIGYRERRRKAA